MKRTAVIGVTVLACGCSILDEGRVSISGHVSLDAEPAVGWYVELLDPRIASLSTEPFPIFPQGFSGRVRFAVSGDSPPRTGRLPT